MVEEGLLAAPRSGISNVAVDYRNGVLAGTNEYVAVITGTPERVVARKSGS